MNPLIQLNRQLQYLFIALLLACFAIPAMGERDETPNHREFFLHTITGQVSPPCGSEAVDIRGMVTLKFGFKKVDLPGGRTERFFQPVDTDLAKGIGNINCPNSGQCDVGVGKSSGRRYKASKVIAVRDVTNHIDTRNKIPGFYGEGTCALRLFVTGNPNPAGQGESCPECTFKRFSVDYTISYLFNKNDKVTDFKVIKRAVNIICPSL